MNDIERNNKTVLELIDILIRSSLDIQRVKELVNLKKELNQPTQPEGYQGLNKWYRTNMGHIIYAVQLNYFNCYGIRVKTELNRETGWCNDFALNPDIIDRLATESEIKEAILKGCEQNGIVEGARVKSLFNGQEYVLKGGEHSLALKSNKFMFHGVSVFDNGKFAEVVKEEKPSDKELLKECLLYVEYFENWTDNEKRKELLKRIKETLK